MSFAASVSVPSRADVALVCAVEQGDAPAAIAALAEGASPNARKPYRGLIGEPVVLMAVRRGDAPVVQALLNAGADVTSAVVMAAGLLVERATRAGTPDGLAAAERVFASLEEQQADWGVSDRLIGGGLRAIDLLAAAQPQWARAAAARLGLTPVGVTQASASPSPGRTRRHTTP